MIKNKKDHMKSNIGRNPSEAFDFHVITMVILMRCLNRKIKKSKITSETKILETGEIADLCVHFADRPLYYELQRDINNKWMEKIRDRDLKIKGDTMIIGIKRLEKKYGRAFRALTKEIDEYAISER